LDLELDDVLARIHTSFPKVPILLGKTALLIIDMQKMAGVDYVAEEAERKGIEKQVALRALTDMDKRIRAALRNAKAVLGACREKGIPVVHAKIESRTTNGRDIGRLHRKLDFVVSPGSEWGEFSDEVRPIDGEIVLTKTCSGAFVGTDLDRILRNMGIENLIIMGFYTDQCVETAARDAADIGYDVVLVEDACATYTQRAHQNALESIGDVYVKLETTEAIVRDIKDSG
jgi:nicotinamidase-related amidase